MHPRRERLPTIPQWPQQAWRRWQSWLLVAAVLALDTVSGVQAMTGDHMPDGTNAWAAGVRIVLWWQLVFVPVSSVLLLWRFPRPELVTAVLVVLNPLGSLALFVALFHLATRRISAFVLAVAVVQVLLALWTAVALTQAGVEINGSGVEFTGSGNPTWQQVMLEVLVPSVVVTAAIIGAAAYRGQRRDAVITLHERLHNAELARENTERTARLSERQLIAREMHDVLAHRMSLVTLHAGALVMQADALSRVDTARGAKLHRSAELVREHSQLALDELRDVLGVLREDDETRLAPPLALPDLPRIIDGWRQAGMRVQVQDPDRVTEGSGAVPLALSRHAARTVREAMTNASRHSPGAPVLVSLRRYPHRLLVQVVNGAPAGPPLGPGAGQGLAGLRERVELAGGFIEARPLGDGGFRVLVSLPLTGSSTEAEAPDRDGSPVVSGPPADGDLLPAEGPATPADAGAHDGTGRTGPVPVGPGKVLR